MGVVRRQIDDDFGVALTQKTLEVGVVRMRAKALLGCSGSVRRVTNFGGSGQVNLPDNFSGCRITNFDNVSPIDAATLNYNSRAWIRRNLKLN